MPYTHGSVPPPHLALIKPSSLILKLLTASFEGASWDAFQKVTVLKTSLGNNVVIAVKVFL